MKLKKSLCSTVDRTSNNCTTENITQGPLYKTMCLKPTKKSEKNRKKSVSFGVGVWFISLASFADEKAHFFSIFNFVFTSQF